MTDIPDTSRPPRPAKKTLRQLLAQDPFVIAPGVYDLFGLRAIEQAGYASAAISGAVLSHLLLGLPDVGVLGLAESVEHCRRLTRRAAIPISADADAGYGNALGVFHTVELFEEAGAAGVNIEDQVVPRRFGSGSGKEVVSTEEMVGKIEAACLARRSDDFAIIVRTDAFACEPTDAVLRRARAYEAAGADLLMPVAPKDADDVARIVEALRVPVSINMATGLAPSPSSAGLTMAQLRALGVRRVSLPNLLPALSAGAMEAGLRQLRGQAEGQAQAEPPAPSLARLKALMQDQDWIALENRLLKSR